MSNRIQDAFHTVHADQSLKENTKKALSAKMQRYRSGARPAQSRYAARAAAAVLCFVVLLSGIGGYSVYAAPVSAISIDVNPSLELELNRLDRIVAVTCYNEDAEKIIAGLKLKHKTYEEAVTAILESEKMQDYLAKNPLISISVLSSDETKSQEIEAWVNQCAEEGYENIECHISDGTETEEAHHEGVTFGKYDAFLELQALDPSIEIDQVRELSMHEIHEMIEEHSCEEAAGDEEESPDSSEENCDEENSSGKHGEESGETSHHGGGHD